MRKLATYLILTAGVAACDSATKTVGPEGADSPPVVAVRALVDPSSLTPEPPPGAVCWGVGGGTICHTERTFASENEPIFDLPCGTVYQTGTDIRLGLRWYDADKNLVRLSYTQTANAIWSLSPEGADPTVTVTARANWTGLFAVPGDESTEYGGHTAGEGVKVWSPGVGVIALVAGIDAGETHHGIFIVPEDPAVITEICAALTR